MRNLILLAALLTSTTLAHAQQETPHFRQHLESTILFTEGSGNPGNGTNNPIGAAPSIAALSASNGTLNESWSLSPQLTNAAADVEWSISPPLPLGLSFDESTGAIGGIAGEMRMSTPYTLRAENAHGYDEETFSFTVYDKVTMADVTLNVAPGDEIDETLAAVGGDGAYDFSWDTSSPARPGWLDLVDGVLSGTVAGSTIDDLVLRVEDSEGRWDTALLDIVVAVASEWRTWGEGSSSYSAVAGVSDYTNVGLGAGFGCGIKSGEVWCWGSANRGQLGNGVDTMTNSPPVKAVGLTGVHTLEVGQYHSCAISNASGGNRLYCWGNNLNRQVANNATQNINVPTINSDFSNVASVGVGRNHTCAISGNLTYCWGQNSNGALGNGNTTSTGSSQTVKTGPSTNMTAAVSVHAGTDFSCATFANGTMSCWGTSYFGQTALGSMPNSQPYATPIANNSGGITQVSAHGEYMCFLRNGTPFCSGRNSVGQLGNNGTNSVHSPVQFGSLTNVAEIVATEQTTCALKTDGTVWCSGTNAYGQMGDHGANSLVPVQLTGLTGITDIAGSFRSLIAKN